MRSERDGAIDVVTGALKLERLDIVRDVAMLNELQTVPDWRALHGALGTRFKQWAHQKFAGANVTSFWSHDLQRVTMGDVLEDTTGLWQKRLGNADFKTLAQGRESGLISNEMILDPHIYRYKDKTPKAGQIRDVRAGTSRMLDTIFTLFDPFGQGKVIRSLLDRGPRVDVIPPPPGKGGVGFFIGETLYKAVRSEQVGNVTSKILGLEPIATNLRLARTGDPFNILRAIRHTPGRVGEGYIAEPKGNRLRDKFQRATGVGTAYASHRSLFQALATDPITRARAITSGKGVVFGRPFKYKGSRFLEGTPAAAVGVPEAASGAKEILKGGAAFSQRGRSLTNAEFLKLGAWDRTKILYGAHADYEVIKASTLLPSGRPKRLLTEQDKIVPFELGGAKDVERTWGASDVPLSGKFVEATLTGVGERSPGMRAKYYATPKGFLASATDFANYSFFRINALASTFGAGIGFKASGRPWKNAARLAAIPILYKGGFEALGYADFVVEDITGVSPIKTLASAYAALRVGQQDLRELLGITSVAGGLEKAYPGLVESEGMTLLRSILAPGAMFLRGLSKGFGKAAIRAGVTYAAIGGPALSQPAEELRQEYAGERKIPVRRGATWGLGYQPFFGGDISHFEYSWHHKLQTDYRTKSIYGSRAEYYGKHTNVFGIPFPTPHSAFGMRQLIDPYALERKHYYDRPYPETSGRFDEVPIIGPMLSELDALIPIIGKERQQMHVGELMGIPTSGASLTDRTIPPSAARRLGIVDIPATAVVYQDASDPLVRLREQAAVATEPLGVYKFALEFFGVDLDTVKPAQMAKSTTIGSLTREFYDMGIGGLFGQTEFPRRFLLSEQGLASKQRQLLNPLRNTMPTWLPGVGSEVKSDEDYFLDFLHGDPYARLEQGEARLPGVGYEALNPLHSGVSGFYDEIDQLIILADVAPYSMAFQQARERIEPVLGDLPEVWQSKVNLALAQRDVVVNQLSAYSRYTPETPEALSILNEGIHEAADMAQALAVPGLQGAWDVLSHDVLAEIPYIGSKFFPFRDPVERYEKEQIYGDTFADWHRPWETIGRPAMYDMARADPLAAGAKGAVLGALMSSPFGALLNPFTPLRGPGAVPLMAGAGLMASLTRSVVADQDFIPPHKQKEIEAMEYMDMMQYMKSRSYQIQAEELGDVELAAGYEQLAEKTFVGAKSYQDIRSAMGSSDRQYLNAFLGMGESQRGRLVNALPTYYMEAIDKIREDDFESTSQNDTKALQYFKDHAAIPEDSLLWHPSVPTTAMKIKMIQGGINGVSDNLHRFGFFESQGIEANLRFPDVHYQKPFSLNMPNFNSFKNRLMHQLRRANPFDEHPDRTQIRKTHGSFHDIQFDVDQTIDRREQTYFYMADLMR